MRADRSRKIDNQPRDIARRGAQIENPPLSAGLEPFPHEIQNETITAKPSVQLPDPLEVAFQFGRNGLGSVHHFQHGWIESSPLRHCWVKRLIRCISSIS